MKRTLLLAALVALFLHAPAFAKRKSPVRHSVRTYTRRDGTVVHSHMAGNGAPSTRKSGSRRRGSASSGGSDFGSDDSEGGSFDGQSAPVGNQSDHLYDTYQQEPTLEPSWVRQQRLERSLNMGATKPQTAPKSTPKAKTGHKK